MFYNGIPQSYLEDITTFDNDNYGENFGFSGFSYLDPSNVAGPSQIYTGAEVMGNWNSYPDFPTPSSVPTSLDPPNGLDLHEAYASQFYSSTTMASSSQGVPYRISTYSSLIPSPSPSSSHGIPFLSPDEYTVPITPSLDPCPQTQAISNPDGLDLGLPLVAEGLSLPSADPTGTYDPTWGDLLSEPSPSDPFGFNPLSSDVIAGTTPPEINVPVPAASSSGSRRRRERRKEGQRHNPLGTKKWKIGLRSSSEDGWNQTLVRFRAFLDGLYSVHNGQPPGGLVPEMALARLKEFIKEDLKRSPLRDTKSAEGTRSRDVEVYLEGLLEAIRRVNPTPVPPAGESNESCKILDTLSGVADELEARLVVMNQRQALRRTIKVERGAKDEQSEEKKIKNGTEKERRRAKRYQVERISRLFKVSRVPRARKDVLGLAVMFLLCGPAAFPPGFIQVRPTNAEL